MEIERKFAVKHLPDNLEQYQCLEIEQGYLCRKPTIRIRKSNDDYYMTYKNKVKNTQSVAIVNEEVELPLNETAYQTLKEKIEGRLVKKHRYVIPLSKDLKAELDIFDDVFQGLVFVEVEFPNEEAAEEFVAPEWFGKDLSADKRFSNGYLSTLSGYDELNL